MCGSHAAFVVPVPFPLFCVDLVLPNLGQISVLFPSVIQLARLQLYFVVLTDDGPSLLSRDWHHHLKLDWQQINKLHGEALHQVLQRHEKIFKDGLGTPKG